MLVKDKSTFDLDVPFWSYFVNKIEKTLAATIKGQVLMIHNIII